MAPILLLSNPEINPKILPKLSNYTGSLIFYLNDIKKCIEMVNSMPPDTRLPIYFISDHLESIESSSMDGLLALLLSLETFLKEFQFNWIILEQENWDEQELSMWKDAFPYINFTYNCVSSIRLPQIGQIQSKQRKRLHRQYFLTSCSRLALVMESSHCVKFL